MKKTVKLTESELKGLIKEAATRALNEYGGMKYRYHKEPLHIYNGMVVLRHDSSTKITNGKIDRTGRGYNGYSKNSDRGNYFWASESIGHDPSNGKMYNYYCFVDPSLIYDYEKNPKGYESLDDAMDNEQYVSGRWGDGAIAVMTDQPTPISYIWSDDHSGDDLDSGLFDAKWHMLRSGTVTYRKRINAALARKLRPNIDKPVPDFLADYGFSYEDVVNHEVYY